MRRGPLARQLPPAGGGSDELRRLVARQLVTEEIVVDEAESAGLGVNAPLRLLVPRLFARITSGIKIELAEVRAYYERNLDLYWTPESRHVGHILVNDPATARLIVRRLRRGIPFGTLARRYSLDSTSRAAGGDIGQVSRGQLTGPFEEALFAVGPGELVGPLRTEQGWHVARVESVMPEGYAAFDEVRASIETDLLEAAREQAFEAWLEVRRAQLVVLEPEFAHPADPANRMPTHRH